MGSGSNMHTALYVYVSCLIVSVNLSIVNPCTQTVVDNRLHSMSETVQGFVHLVYSSDRCSQSEQSRTTARVIWYRVTCVKLMLYFPYSIYVHFLELFIAALNLWSLLLDTLSICMSAAVLASTLNQLYKFRHQITCLSSCHVCLAGIFYPFLKGGNLLHIWPPPPTWLQICKMKNEGVWVKRCLC